MKFFLAMLFLLYSLACNADIYQQTDVDGNTIYSDTPNQNAEKLSIPTGNTIPSILKKPTAIEQNPSNTTPQPSYTSFTISSPSDQSTFQNQHEISVIVHTVPELQNGDKVQLMLDGAAYGEAKASTQLTLSQVNRGTHTLYAVLLNPKEVVLQKTNSITLYIHYAALAQ